MGQVHARKRYDRNGNFKSWEYRFEAAPINGKRNTPSKAGFRTKAEAIEAGLAALAAYKSGGQVVKPSEMSYADFLDKWMSTCCAVQVKETTLHGYEKAIRLYIKPELGHYMVSAIRKENLEVFLQDMFDKSFSANTISRVRGILSKSFRWAVDHKYIIATPADRLQTPKKKTKDKVVELTEAEQKRRKGKTRDSIPPEQIKQIFERFPVDTPNHVQLMLGYKCGLRLGEAFGLCWDNVDFKKKVIHIRRQVQWMQDKNRTEEQKKATNGKTGFDNGYWYFTEPKWNSVRTIEIDDELCDLLRNEKAEQDRAKEFYGKHWVYYYEDADGNISIDSSGKVVNFVAVRKAKVLSGQAQMPGSFISPRTMQHTSSVIHHQMGFPQFDFHSLRHTHATMLCEAGAQPKYVQKRLGHKNIEVTLMIYTHVSEKMSEQGRAVLNSMFDPEDLEEYKRKAQR